MPQGDVLELLEDVQNPGHWEDDNFAMDFVNYADIKAGQTLAGTPTVASVAPSGATSLTLGARQTATINGTQVIFSITLPQGAPPNYVYPVTCTVGTSGGETLVQAGSLLAQGSY